jgi:metal-responsive CopG/Arc/MetJ family transcriptional regulator
MPAQQGMITVLFEKEQKSARPALMSLKNEYQEIISASFQAGMAGELALEIILVHGDTARIRLLEQQLGSKRGIRSVRLTVIPS